MQGDVIFCYFWGPVLNYAKGVLTSFCIIAIVSFMVLEHIKIIPSGDVIFRTCRTEMRMFHAFFMEL
jgi:hypothetical protein